MSQGFKKAALCFVATFGLFIIGARKQNPLSNSKLILTSFVDEVVSISGQTSNLTISGILTSTVYSCTAFNRAGSSLISSSEVSLVKKGMRQFDIYNFLNYIFDKMTRLYQN